MKNLKKKFRFRIHLKSKHLLVIMTLFCGSTIVATLASGITAAPFQEAAGAIVVPFEKSINTIGVWLTDLHKAFKDKQDLVDANEELQNTVDTLTEQNLEKMIPFIKDFSRRTGSVIAVTGGIDLVSDAKRCFVIRNGRPEMGRITGTGCQLSGMMTAFLAANPENNLEAAAAAVCAMGLAGETGWKYMQPGDGNATYRNRIIDAIYNMEGKELEEGAKYEIR